MSIVMLDQDPTDEQEYVERLVQYYYDKLHWEFPRSAVPDFLCWMFFDTNLGCDCDGRAHPIDWIEDEDPPRR